MKALNQSERAAATGASSNGEMDVPSKSSSKSSAKKQWPKYDKEEVKRRMRGRWLAYFQQELQLGEEYLSGPYLNGTEGPCPKSNCVGRTRFCVIDADEGVLFCRHCFDRGNGDGLSASAWILDKNVVEDFPELLHRAAVFAGVRPTDGGKRNRNGQRGGSGEKDAGGQKESNSRKLDDSRPKRSEVELAEMAAVRELGEDAFLVAVCEAKGMPISSAQVYGARVRWWGGKTSGERVVEFPLYDETGVHHVANRFGLSHVSDDEALCKGKCVKGGKHGLFLPHHDDGSVQLPRPGEMWIFVEGVKDAAALHSLGFNAAGLPTNTMNARFAPLFVGVDVVLVPDLDRAGQEGAAKTASRLVGAAASILIARLPGEVSESDGEDVRDVLAGSGGEAAVRNAIHEAAPADIDTTRNVSGLPEVELPGGERKISAAATDFAVLLAEKRIYFVRGGVPVRLIQDENRTPRLRPVEPAEMASDIELVARPVVSKAADQGFVESNCNAAMANLMLSSRAFHQALPGIRVLSPCPLLIERDGELIQVIDFDEASGVYAYGRPVDHIPIETAKSLLRGLISEFRFGSEADHSRALAAMLTPALVLGGLLAGRAPVDLGEADESQTGKGYRNKITAAIYCHQVMAISQSSGSVGSLEESFDRSLIDGKNFIAIDNVRGRINSPKIESFLTEDAYYARCAYAPDTEINPHRVCVMFTSNKADLTVDLANRCSCVRILKQPEGYQFQTYAEGDLLSHVRANQPRYLGAVFAVVRAWYAAGKPRTNETRHDFRAWAQTLDWIVQNIFGEPPLMDGHKETQRRMTNPAMGWLREVMLAVIRQSKLTDWLIAAELIDLMEVEGVEVPGLKGGSLEDDATRKTVLQQVGRKLKRCFGDEARIELDGYIVDREAFYDSESRERVRYRVVLGDPADNPADSPLMRPLVNSRESSDPANDFPNTHACAHTHTHAHAHGETTEGISGISGVPKNISGVISGDQGAHQRGAGEEGLECPKCGSKKLIDVPIHNGQSTRRECGNCGHHIGFSKWYGREINGQVGEGVETA